MPGTGLEPVTRGFSELVVFNEGNMRFNDDYDQCSDRYTQ